MTMMENVVVDAFTCRDYDQREDNRDGWLSAKAGPAPTFSLSNAPVYNPEKVCNVRVSKDEHIYCVCL